MYWSGFVDSNQGNFQFEFVSFSFGRVYAIGDLNGDGRPDLITHSETILKLGNRNFTQILNNNLPIETGDLVGLGDFNGDGILDAAFVATLQGGGSYLSHMGWAKVLSIREAVSTPPEPLVAGQWPVRPIFSGMRDDESLRGFYLWRVS